MALHGPLGHLCHGVAHHVQGEPGHIGGVRSPLDQLFHLVFHAGQGRRRAPAASRESAGVGRAGPAGKSSPRRSTGAVNELPGGSPPTNDLGLDGDAVQQDQQQLGGAAGQVPGQEGPVRGSRCPADQAAAARCLVGVGKKGHPQGPGQTLPPGIPPPESRACKSPPPPGDRCWLPLPECRGASRPAPVSQTAGVPSHAETGHSPAAQFPERAEAAARRCSPPPRRTRRRRWCSCWYPAPGPPWSILRLGLSLAGLVQDWAGSRKTPPGQSCPGSR